MSWLARLDAALDQRARERSEESESGGGARASGPSPEGGDAKQVPHADAALGGGASSFADAWAGDRAQVLEKSLSSPSSPVSQHGDAAALLRGAEQAAEALAAPDPKLDAERAAIHAEPELLPEGTPERARLDARQAAMVCGLLDASMQRPSRWPNLSLVPTPGAYCARGRRWCTEAGPLRRGWRCIACHPPDLRPEPVMEVET
jgi:hypothetical protein